ncbi:unnamed protein product [Lasius platythorax]|uniref:Uncharacterized protein n=1 Tax=Lasius platythorax TaxID=488582 RepID=A0AAV2NUA9_9HYME
MSYMSKTDGCVCEITHRVTICVAIVYCVSKYEIPAQHFFIPVDCPPLLPLKRFLVLDLYSTTILRGDRKIRETPNEMRQPKSRNVARYWQIAQGRAITR